jgi:hypothetical protein
MWRSGGQVFLTGNLQGWGRLYDGTDLSVNERTSMPRLGYNRPPCTRRMPTLHVRALVRRDNVDYE